MTEVKTSSAARYREILDARRAEQLKTAEIFDVQTPSGMTWQVKRPNMETYVVSGVLPHSMTDKVIKAMQDGKAESETDLLKTLSPSDAFKSIIFARELVRDICVNPRIVEDPQTDDEIAPNEVDLEDFKYLTKWAMQNAVGGAEAARLGNFRGKSDAASVSGTAG